jgi:zinc D-Ala-D-Ala dipeptidase
MRLRQAALLGSAAALLLPAAAFAAGGALDYQQRFDTSQGTYHEGSVSHVRVRDTDGRVVLERTYRVRPRFRLRHPLPQGIYRVRSFQRPCDGNCGTLDPPTDSCSRRFRILPRGRTAVRVTVRPGRGCRIAAEAQPALFQPRARLPTVRRAEQGALAAFPATRSIRRARAFVRRRATSSLAVIDSAGRLRGHALHRRYVSGSIVKVMLLVAYLRKLDGRMPPRADQQLLHTMIVLSGNKVASIVQRKVGTAALWQVARDAGMRDFSVSGSWGSALISAADQARFVRRFDRMIPARTRGYARGLMSSIDIRQRWGFPRPALDLGFEAFFKVGWRGTAAGRLVHAVGMFEREDERVSLAVLTDANPSHDFGTDTIRGAAERVFEGVPPAAAPAQELAGSRAHRRAGLVDVHRYAPGIALDIVYASEDNITDKRLPGYCKPWALMQEPAARDLGRVQRYLRRRGLGLLIFDAYRPARATRALVSWAERTGRGDLVGTYLARRSNHNLGSAVDLTLVRLSDGRRLRMGRYDALGPGAHTYEASGRVLRNRLVLKGAMERFGFTNYWREWWHFDHRLRGARYLDLTLGCG